MGEAGDRICCTFSICNIIGFISGGLLTGFSVWLLADKLSFFTELNLYPLDENESGDEFQSFTVIDYFACILVGVGVAALLKSLLGCTALCLGCCGSSKARSCLLTYSLVVAIVILLEIIGAVLVLHVYKGEIERGTEQFLLKSLQEDYRLPSQGEPNGVTVLWNHIMSALECCGVSSYRDFETEPTVIEGEFLVSESVPFEVPASCCSSPNDTLLSACSSSADDQLTRGCYSVLLTHSVPAVAASIAMVATFQVAAVILACCLCSMVEDTGEWHHI